MRALHRGLLVALAHLVLVSTLGAKLLYDRGTRPRVWVKTVPYDPDLPIRGRYVRLRLEVNTCGCAELDETTRVALAVEDDRLVATPTDARDGQRVELRLGARRNEGRALANALGLGRLRTVAPAFAAHLDVQGGAWVAELTPGSPAAKAGLTVGDVLISIEGEPARWPADVNRLVAEHRERREISLEVLRDHERLALLIVRDLDSVAPEDALVLAEPVAFFIPEHVPDPSRRPAGEELWVEVTLPKKGPPRPIRLGVRKGTDAVTPLPLD